MSVSVTHSPPCCSHPSSPASCSPSSNHALSPAKTRIFGSIPRSSAASPLPFVLSGDRRKSESVDVSTSTRTDLSPISPPNVEGKIGNFGFLAESQRGSVPSSAAAKFLRTRKSFSAIQAKAAVSRATKASPRPGSASRDSRRLERSSSGSDVENEVEMGEATSLATRMRLREPARPKRQSSAMLHSDRGDASLGDEEDAFVPSPRRRGRARRSLFTSGLASHFETKVSMTPPARLQHVSMESPFTSSAAPDAPATEARRSTIPRSRAFGPFVPIQDSSSVALPAHEDNHRTFTSVPMRRSAPSPATTLGVAHQSSSKVRTPLRLANALDISKDRRTATPSCFAEPASPYSRRRRTTTSPGSATRHAGLPLDASSSPPSPCPGDVSFPVQDMTTQSAIESAESEDDDANILRPGIYVPTRRVGGTRSVSTSNASQPNTSSGIPIGRSATMSSIEEQPASMLAPLSTTKVDGKTQHSQYKTPHRRRARHHTSSASRNRLLSQASPIAAPVESEEGSLFGSASGSSLAREKSASDMQSASLSVSRDVSLRSLGSGSQSAWLDSSTSPHSLASSHSTWETPAASLHSATPSISFSRQVRKGSLEGEHLIDTSPNIGFDDSGVAFASPTFSLAPRHKIIETRNHALQAFKEAQPIDMQSSPSKLAALRRKSVEHSAPTKGRPTHPFSVRERSALANEARWSDGDSSTTSTPNVQRSVSTTTSAPEGLDSPLPTAIARSKTQGRDELHQSEFVNEQQSSYFTPQPYKGVMPLQTAFMSTGLASKRNKATLNEVNPVTGESVPHLPSRLNYGSTRGHIRASSGSMAASLGLKDIVAAANAHAVASSLSAAPSAMPDTPMKKPSASFAVAHKAPADRPVAPPLGQTMLGLQPASFSPSSGDGNESSSSGGGDSPLLTQACESPTLAMSSNLGMRDLDDARNISMLEAVTSKASQNGVAPVSSRSSPLKTNATARRAAAHMSMPMQALAPDDALRAFLPQRPVSLMRPPLGLQRKSSFGTTSEQASSLVGHSALQETVPSTPTRGNVQIKWYEAAQLASTPSPSHRRDSRDKKRDSWQMGSLRAKGIRPVSGSRSTAVVTSLGTPRPSKMQPSLARQSFYETNFNVLSTLGHGQFSQVDKAEDKRDNCFYAVKRMKRAYVGPRDRLRRLEEVDVLRLLNADGGHLNIVSFIDAWEEAGHLFIQTELCPCVDFASFLQHFSNMGGSLDEARVWKVFRELAEGVRFIHEKGVLHLDIKPANIFITEIATLKIGDFGFATRWPQTDANSILTGAGLNDCDTIQSEAASLPRLSKTLEREGDREYIAPEIIAKGEYGKAADIFSLGLVVLEAAGDVNLPDNGEPWHKLRSNDLSDVDLREFSVSLIRLMERCLCADPAERASIEEVCEHPVLRAVGTSVAKGVQVSELDQLPIFDLPNTESSKSLHASRTMDHNDEDTEMSDDRTGSVDLPPHTPTTEISLSYAILGAGDVISSGSAYDAMERKTSASSALGVEGMHHDDKVLDVRGALIHEDFDFLLSILEAEPDINARLPSGAVHHGLLRQPALVVPTINVADEDCEDEEHTGIFALSPPAKVRHTPSRASPLRQAFLNGDSEPHEMEIDQ